MLIPKFNIYHDGGEIDNILQSFGFVIHSEEVDFKKNSFQFDQRFLKGGRKIVAVPRIDIAHTGNKYPAIENVHIYGNIVSWNYTNFCIGCATIPIIHVFKLI
ncbi:hypothetical protein QE197_09355 [Arsenophonus nasoniae]|nr:hypothetical protein [Arsenophonus nasoniae]QBY42821.1 hypothetical protein ArsFIN_13810 [Arsenophonus nasoniae]QBY43457.1 hypothetical protein ArsFIN_20240 [Arsenophonus nasoniae]QBY43646.1 hypothetical protein ArsFIN_22140 [Arsenophonus nasoniae]QBY44192.1 hypothetical protein ArsFIN_27690 [Arsenophonus nasoniae]QBY44796.1 hypothetical protein ArsFIN_33820 [Arsenophonus nasoniae]